MLKTFKWLYKLGTRHERARLMRIIESQHQYNLGESRVKSLDKDNTYKVSSASHSERAEGLYELLTLIDSKKYPNISSFFDFGEPK